MRRVAIISSYPPERCGIAHYASDLVKALSDAGLETTVASLSQHDSTAPDKSLKWRLARNSIQSYRRLARQVSFDSDVIIVQHEYGLYGGLHGSHVLELMASATVPVVVTLHTIVPPQDRRFREITQEIFDAATALVVHSPGAAGTILAHYAVPAAPLYVISHGAYYSPATCPVRSRIRARLSLKNEPILVTGGFVTRNKGIEYAMRVIHR